MKTIYANNEKNIINTETHGCSKQAGSESSVAAGLQQGRYVWVTCKNPAMMRHHNFFDNVQLQENVEFSTELSVNIIWRKNLEAKFPKEAKKCFAIQREVVQLPYIKLI